MLTWTLCRCFGVDGWMGSKHAYSLWSGTGSWTPDLLHESHKCHHYTMGAWHLRKWELLCTLNEEFSKKLSYISTVISLSFMEDMLYFPWDWSTTLQFLNGISLVQGKYIQKYFFLNMQAGKQPYYMRAFYFVKYLKFCVFARVDQKNRKWKTPWQIFWKYFWFIDLHFSGMSSMEHQAKHDWLAGFHLYTTEYWHKAT